MQSYKTHQRYYPFHHYVMTPLTLIFLSWSFWNVSEALDSDKGIGLSLYLLTGAMILFLLPIMMRIYAIKNQNRIIRMEMRLRYFQLTGKPFYHMEKKLKFPQIIALRFAGSKELLPLMERAIKENMTPRQIKKSIKDWQGDYYRV